MENKLISLTSWGRILEQSVIGQPEAVELSLVTLVAGGHLLLEGPPGVGKTSLAKKIAQSIRGEFHRIQMTSDLLPSDILGTLRMKAGSHDLEFRKGPVFTNVLLADELNRTSAKTQSSLLEAMAESKVSIDGVTYALPDPFFVVATQNPQEFQGVFPLTESQLDRFMMLVELKIPSRDSEMAVLRKHSNEKQQTLQREEISDGSYVDLEVFRNWKKQAENIFLEETVLDYLQKVAASVRKIDGLYYGASIRSTLQLLSAVKARALFKGREFVIPEDIQFLAPHVFAHRLSFRGLEQTTAEKKEKIQNVLAQITAPK